MVQTPTVPDAVPAEPPVPLVLASGSRYRAALLAQAGIAVTIDPPDLDERALDHLFTDLGPEPFALDLAARKAIAVSRRHPGALVIAGDQVGVLEEAGRPPRMLTKQADPAGAVEQLMALSGSTHRLVNGLAVLDLRDRDAPRLVDGLDVQVVTMRPFSRAEATSYVDRFAPFDSSGSYRLEDQDALAPGEGFVVSVQGEDRSGVLGLPLPLLRRLLGQLGVTPASPSPPR